MNIRLCSFIGAALLASQFARAGTIYSTGFSSADAALWGNQRGDWTAGSNQYYTLSPGNLPPTYSSAPTAVLTNFSVTFTVDDASDGGLWLRSSFSNGQASGLLMVVGGDTGTNNGIYFHDVTDDSYSTPFDDVSVPGLQGSDETFTVVAIGDVYSVYLNGGSSPIDTVTDSTFTSGLVGLYDYTPRRSTTFSAFSISTVGVPDPASSAALLLLAFAVLATLKCSSKSGFAGRTDLSS